MKKTYSIPQKTVDQLKEIEDKNGALPSRVIVIAVDKYHKEIIKGE